MPAQEGPEGAIIYPSRLRVCGGGVGNGGGGAGLAASARRHTTPSLPFLVPLPPFQSSPASAPGCALLSSTPLPKGLPGCRPHLVVSVTPGPQQADAATPGLDPILPRWEGGTQWVQGAPTLASFPWASLG